MIRNTLLALILGAGTACLHAAPLPCITATLSSYVTTGPCSIGSIVVSGFTVLDIPSGAPEIGADNITITPIASTYTQTLEFRFLSSVTGSPFGASFEQIFTYLVSPLGTFSSAALGLTEATASGDGVVLALQTACQGAALASDGASCAGPGAIYSNAVVAIDGGTPDLLSAAFGLAPDSRALQVRNEFAIDGGGSGSATGGVVSNSFTAVPEPGATLLVGPLLAGVVLIHRRRATRRAA